MNPQPLKDLRDIHLPDPISFWPLAPGWYILIILFILLLSGAIYFYYRYQKKHRIKKIALKTLDQLKERYLKQPHQCIQALSIFIRRTALSSYPRQQVASLHGKNWLNFLDDTGKTNEFSQGVGRLLSKAPYQPTFNTPNELSELNELFQLITHWVKKNA